MTNIPLWKIVVPETLDIEAVLDAADTTPGLTSEAAEVLGVELQRIDQSKRGTVIFATSSKDGAEVFARLLGRKAEGDARLDEGSVDELLSREPIEP